MFETVQEVAKTDKSVAFSDLFNGILSCPVWAFPKGPNEIKTFKSVKGQNIQHWIMLVPMPVDIDSMEYIQQFIWCFLALTKKPYIRSAYKSGVCAITQHQALRNQISEEGVYWNVIDNAAQQNIIFLHYDCISEVLLDYTIKETVSLMFDVRKDPNTWTDSVKAYAFGN